MSKLEAALAWAARGFRVFPLIEDSKTPLFSDWPERATSDSKTIRAWWRDPIVNVERNYNIACDCSGFLVVDLDCKNGKKGLQEFEAMGGRIDDTLVVKTSTGGFHAYFDSAGLDIANSAGTIAPGIDVRGHRGYVVAPGSVIDGAAYTIEVDAPVNNAPRFIWQGIKLAEIRRAAPTSEIEKDTPSARSAAIAAAIDTEPAIQGAGGDLKTYQTACNIRDLGVSEATALDILLEHWNPRCEPPWHPDELAAKVGNAYAYAQRGEGEKSPAAMFEGVVLPEPEYTATPSGFVSFANVLMRDVPPVEYLIPGLIEKGVATFLSAPGGTHKSRLALQWGLSLEAGVAICGENVGHSAFVYVSYEDHKDEVARRAQVISKRLNLSGIGGHYCDLAGKDSPLAIIGEDGSVVEKPFWKTLTEYLKAIPGHKFVVLDSTYDALRFAGQAKINETSVMLGISLLQRLCDECDATVMVLWHPSQAGQERGDASGWSVAWHNRPRGRLSLKRGDETGEAFDLKVEKHNHGPSGKTIRLYWCDGVLLPRTEIEEVDQEARLLNACVALAVEAAAKNTPFHKMTKTAAWMLNAIHDRCGQRPTATAFKNKLEQAVFLEMLRYQRAHGKTKAGYFPVNEIDN